MKQLIQAITTHENFISQQVYVKDNEGKFHTGIVIDQMKDGFSVKIMGIIWVVPDIYIDFTKT